MLSQPPMRQLHSPSSVSLDPGWAAGFRALPISPGLTGTDLFAGAGGSSTGIGQIPGVWVQSAANHNPIALDIHNANHPDTDHSIVDLHEENPLFFPRTDILWASPECTKWSQAAGGKYNEISIEATLLDDDLMEDPTADAARRSRLLMFDVLRFIETHRYRLVFIENVVDIAVKAKYAYAWKVWKQALRNLGYEFRVISWNSMHAQTYGMPAPQSRDRLYIAAWPMGEKAPDFEMILRPRAYCTKCDQMVESQQAWKNGNTVGKYRTQYVYIHGSCGTIVEPGFLPAYHAIDWSIQGEKIGDRLAEKTRARIAAGIARFWGPFQTEAAGNTYDAADPRHPQHGDPNGYYRTWPMDEVIRALHTTASKALAIPMEGREGKQAQQLLDVLRTQTCRNENGIVTPFISEMYGTSVGRPVDQPAGTFTANGNHHGLVTPYYSGSDHAKPVDQPIDTLTTVDRFALVHRNNNGGAEMTTSVLDYMRTLTTSGHQALLQAPPAVRGRRRQVTDAEYRIAEEMVSEVSFRMFQYTECAAGMAFPDEYTWQPSNRAKPISKRNLTKAIGNAVCPPNARDLVGCGVESLVGAA